MTVWEYQFVGLTRADVKQSGAVTLVRVYSVNGEAQAGWQDGPISTIAEYCARQGRAGWELAQLLDYFGTTLTHDLLPQKAPALTHVAIFKRPQAAG